MTRPKLLEQTRNTIRLHQYGLETERCYVHRIKRHILFHGRKHPHSMRKVEVEAFLSHLSVNRRVSPSTQNLALSAILFLYQHVLNVDLPWPDDVVRG